MSTERETVKLLRALVGKAPLTPEHPDSHLPPPRPTIAMSRGHGAGGEELALMLAEHLGVRCFDKEIVDAIVREAHVDRYLVERLDEHVSGVMEDLVCSFIDGHCVGREDYRRYLARVVSSIHPHGGVIVGRGANLILADRKVFRVRLTGSPLVCARRLAAREGFSVERALKCVLSTDQERALFIFKLFGRDLNDPADYDLVVNTDRLGPSETLEIVLQAMHKAGFPVERRAHAAV
jgi:cytidylate kinase